MNSDRVGLYNTMPQLICSIWYAYLWYHYIKFWMITFFKYLLFLSPVVLPWDVCLLLCCHVRLIYLNLSSAYRLLCCHVKLIFCCVNIEGLSFAYRLLCCHVIIIFCFVNIEDLSLTYPLLCVTLDLSYISCVVGVLDDHSYDFTNVVYALLYINDMSQFGNINAVYKQYFGINPPTRFVATVYIMLASSFVIIQDKMRQ